MSDGYWQRPELNAERFLEEAGARWYRTGDLVRRHPICIATSGLHRSTGWKFAEYLAMSRAIVSEKLHMRLPGPIAADTHYLEFDNFESCVTAVARLFEDAGKRNALMHAAATYSLHHVRPDALVAESLRRALAWRETKRQAS